MRILYHHRTQADGAEGIHIAAMVSAFRTLGHEIRVIGPPGAGAPGRPGLGGWVKAHAPQAVFEVAAMALNGTDYLAVRQALGDFRPDLLYKRHARYDLGALEAVSRAGVASVLEVNCLFSLPPYADFEPMQFTRTAARFERRALDLSTVVAAVSTPLADQAAALAGREVLVLPNGVDAERFDPGRVDGARVRSQFGLAGQFVVGWTGIVREWHGLETLLEAVMGIDDARLLVVGDGPAREALCTRAARAGQSDRLVVTGRIAHDAVPAHIAAMDVCTVADERTGVASPMKLLEYLAMGKAVVAPQTSGIGDIVRDGDTALLFPPGDVGALRRAIDRLRRDASERARLGAQARRMVLERSTWTAVARRVLDAVSRAERAELL